VPTPVSVTRENPAGDAQEPEDAALTRLLSEPLGNRFDTAHTIVAALPDSRNWERVRIFGHPRRMAYRYGDRHYAVTVVDYRAAEGGQDTAEACLARFVDRSKEEAERQAMVGPIVRGEGTYEPGVEATSWSNDSSSTPKVLPMPYVRVGAELTTLFRRDRYLGAAVAYRSWSGTCLVHAFGVRVGTDEALARRVVDRWVGEIAPLFRWTGQTKSPPPFEDR
jgi:hypothetical protein